MCATVDVTLLTVWMILPCLQLSHVHNGNAGYTALLLVVPFQSNTPWTLHYWRRPRKKHCAWHAHKRYVVQLPPHLFSYTLPKPLPGRALKLIRPFLLTMLCGLHDLHGYIIRP